MKIDVMDSAWDGVRCDALLLPLFEDDDFESGVCAEVDRRLDGLLSEIRATEEWLGEFGDCTVLYRPQGLPFRRLVLVGAGKKSEYDLASIRDLTMLAVRKVKGYDLQSVAIFRRSEIDPYPAAQAAVEGVTLATYEGDDYKTEDKSKNFINEVRLITPAQLDSDQFEWATRKGYVIGQATNLARRLVNQPGNEINPTRLAAEARRIADKHGLEIDVLEEPEMEAQGMDSLMAVARGSEEPARLIILKHSGAEDDSPPLVFVGKGVTFDSGGLSLKPPKSMEDMKCDKAGACAVLAALQAIAELGVKRDVIGVLPTVENMVSGRAQRPGDIVRSLSGKTIEVLNTDAEGRLILADALYYAHRYKPEMIVDLATLTGACVVALGNYRAGLFSNDEQACERVLASSIRAGERLWRLPLDDHYRDLLDSPIADIRNIGDRWGGAITAAKFLQEFVGDIPWCHLDIAGVDQYPESSKLKGATGFGVRTLVELATAS